MTKFTPRISFLCEADMLPDPYLLLATAKQHLADHQPMTQGDEQAWDICNRLQNQCAGEWPPEKVESEGWAPSDLWMGIFLMVWTVLFFYGMYRSLEIAWNFLKGWLR